MKKIILILFGLLPVLIFGQVQRRGVDGGTGGLLKKGIVTSDSDSSEGIYSFDASGGAFNFTLPAATGSQERKLFIGQDVETNAVTVKVQAGEELNDIVDGTFIASIDGQILLAVDRDVGLWDITVVGISQSGESLVSNMDLSDISATNTTLIQGTNPGTGQTALHNDGTATITRIGDKGISTLRITTDDDDNITITFGTSIVPSGGKILSMSVNGFHRWDASSMTVSSSGNTISFNRSTAIDTDVSFELTFITNGWDELNQQILAGMYTVTPLHNAARVASLNSFTGTDDPIAFDITNKDKGSMITSSTIVEIQQDGVYIVSFNVSGDMNESTSGDRFIYVVKNNTNPTNDAAALAASILGDHSYASGSVVGITQWGAENTFDLVDGDELILYFASADGADRIRMASFNVRQDAIMSAVNPDSYPVIDDDTFVSATDANVPTSESVKAYVDVSGGTLNHRTITASGNTTVIDHYILCNHSSSMTITIRTVDILTDRIFHISDITGNAGTNNITIATEGSETINGSATALIDTNNGWFEILATSTTTLFITSF